MNDHLNLFTFFNQKNDSFIENNVTRALVCTLQQDRFVLLKFIYLIDPDLLVSLHENAGNIDIGIEMDIQKASSSIPIDDEDSIIALALVPGADANSKRHTKIIDFTTQPKRETNAIPDFYLRIMDTLILCEVKIDETRKEDYLDELHNHVKKLNLSTNNNIKSVLLPWNVLIDELLGLKVNPSYPFSISPIAIHFLDYIKSRFYGWFPDRALSAIPFPKDEDHYSKYLLSLRISRIKQQVREKLKILDDPKYSDREEIPFTEPWANEVHVFAERINQEDCITVGVWPGDTKAQGGNIFGKKDLNRLYSKSEIKFVDKNFKLQIRPQVKFAVWQKGTAWIYFDPYKETKLHTASGFNAIAGRWKRGRWQEFVDKMNQLAIYEDGATVDWRDICEWDSLFVKSKKNQVDVSIGFEVKALIPYSYAQTQDKDLNDTRISDLIAKIFKFFQENLFHDL